jgi:TP901 family phage tail tape measure protein
MAGTRGVEAGKAFIAMGLADEMVRRRLRQISRMMTSFGNKLRMVGKTGFAAGAALNAAFTGALLSFSKMGDALDKMAIRTAISRKALSELKFAAEQSGTSIESLVAALFRMRRRVANAVTETGPAVRALKELGLSATELTKLAPEKMFERITDSLAGMADENRRAQMAFEIFGDNARDLFPLINTGTGAIAELRQELRKLGGVLDDETVKAAADLTDALNRLRTQIAAVIFYVGAAVYETLEPWLEKATEILRTVIDWVKANAALIATISMLSTALMALSAALIGVGFAISAIGFTIGGLLSSWGALVLLAGTWITVLLRVTNVGEQLMRVFRALGRTVGEVLEGIAAAMASEDTQEAGRVMMLGLEMVFKEGVFRLEMVWVDFMNTMLDHFADMLVSIRKLWVGMYTSLAGWMISIRGFWQRETGRTDTSAGELQQLWAIEEEELAKIRRGMFTKILPRLQRPDPAPVYRAKRAWEEARQATEQAELERLVRNVGAIARALAAGQIPGLDMAAGGGGGGGLLSIKSRAPTGGIFDPRQASRFFGTSQRLEQQTVDTLKQILEEDKAIRAAAEQGGLVGVGG